MPEKPITMRIDEFKESFVNVMNESHLPAWLLLMLVDPYVKQLQQFDEADRAREKSEYEEALNKGEETEESTEEPKETEE